MILSDQGDFSLKWFLNYSSILPENPTFTIPTFVIHTIHTIQMILLIFYLMKYQKKENIEEKIFVCMKKEPEYDS